MSDWSPPAVSQPALGIGVAACSLLLGILVGLVLAVLYFLWRFLAAMEALAEATQRLADQQAGCDWSDGSTDGSDEDEAFAD